jgi:transcriptional regulator with XRE-family HTH domain
MYKEIIDFEAYFLKLRTKHHYSLKVVADKLNIDNILLIKIEHIERQVQGHMLKPLAELFNLDYKEIQIQFLNQKIETDYGNEPYFIESIEQYLNNFSKKNK